MAATLDRLAELHEAPAGHSAHPLAPDSAERAAGERELAVQERAAAEWLRQIANRPIGPVDDAGPSPLEF